MALGRTEEMFSLMGHGQGPADESLVWLSVSRRWQVPALVSLTDLSFRVNAKSESSHTCRLPERETEEGQNCQGREQVSMRSASDSG